MLMPVNVLVAIMRMAVSVPPVFIHRHRHRPRQPGEGNRCDEGKRDGQAMDRHGGSIACPNPRLNRGDQNT